MQELSQHRDISPSPAPLTAMDFTIGDASFMRTMPNSRTNAGCSVCQRDPMCGAVCPFAAPKLGKMSDGRWRPIQYRLNPDNDKKTLTD
jgi:hypothetical protein